MALLTTGAIGANQLQNEYVQYGFLGILLSILIWYSRSSYKENLRRDLKQEKEKEQLIDRYETDKEKTQDRHEREMEEERSRYHEMHLELMALLKIKINNHE